MAKGPASGKHSIYSNQPGVKNMPASGKPHPSPDRIVTGAGKSGSANWNAFTPARGPGKK